MQDLIRLFSFLVRLSRGIERSRWTIVAVALAGLLSGLASAGMVAFINHLLVSSGGLTAAASWSFAGLCIALPLFRFLSRVTLIQLVQRSLVVFRLQLARRMLAAPLRQLEELGPHRLLAVLTNDIGTIVDAFGMVPVLLMHAATVIGCLVYLGSLSWAMLVEIVVFLVVGAVTYQLPLNQALGRFHRARERYNDLMKYMQALTEGTKELKMHRARQGAFLTAMEGSAIRLQRENRACEFIYSAATSWGQALFFVAVGLLLLLLPRLQGVETKVLVGYTLVLFQMMVPLEVLMNAFPVLSRAAASVRTVEEVGFSLAAPGAAPRQPDRRPFADWQSLDLVGVTHGYRGENAEESFVLGPLDLSVKAGELVFIVGGNGSGKTTLAKILLGLYQAESGEIRLGGRHVTAATLDDYRESFSAVFADFFLFDELFGLAGPALDENARRYLARLHLDHKVRMEAGRLSTVDELSHGQRKRLALLTVYLEDRPIYLFDEWAADQDPVFKQIFYLEMLPELKMRGKTVFVISHDDHYYHLADRVLTLNYGKLESDSLREVALSAGSPGLPSPPPGLRQQGAERRANL